MATLSFSSISAATATSITGVASLDGAAFNSGNAITIESPFYPSRDISNTPTPALLGVTEIQMPAAALSTVFVAGCQMVFGRPQFKATLTSQPTLTNANGPYTFDTSADTWSENFTNTPVEVDSRGNLVGLTEGIRITVLGAVTGENPIIRGDDTCQPIFYGVSWDLRGLAASNFNFVGGTTFVSDVDAAPQFYDNYVYVANNAGDRFRRFLGTNYIIRGMQMTNPNTGGSSFEFFGSPQIGASGLGVVHNFNQWGARAALIGVETGGRTAQFDAQNRFYFDTPRFPCLPIWYGNGGGTRTYNPDRGITYRNPVPAPVPWTRGSATGTIPVMGTQSVDVNASVTERTGAGSAATFQTLNIILDAPGYTLRVRKEETEVWNWGRTGGSNVTYGGETRTSNGLYTYQSNHVTATLGNGNRPVGAETTSTSGDGNPTENAVADATEAPRLTYVDYRGDETIVWAGLDVEKSTSSFSIAVLASHQLSRDFKGIAPAAAPTGNPPAAILGTKFFRYSIWAQHDERGTTDVVTLDFTPEGWNASGALTAGLGLGNEIDIELSSALDVLYDAESPVDPSLTLPLTTTQEMYNAVKTFNRTRGVTTAYDPLHLNTDVSILDDPVGNLMDVGDADINIQRTVTTTIPEGVRSSNVRLEGVGVDDLSLTRIGGANARQTFESGFGPSNGEISLFSNNGASQFVSGYFSPLAPGSAWSSAMSLMSGANNVNNDELFSGTGYVLIYSDATNWAVYQLSTNRQNAIGGLAGVVVRELGTLAGSMGVMPAEDAPMDVVIGQLSVLYSDGMATTSTAPRVAFDGTNMVISLHEELLTRAGNVDGFTTLGDVDFDGQRLDNITVSGANLTNVIAPGTTNAPADIDTAGGIYSGNIALMPGSYNVYGDWSGMRVSRAASTTGNVELNFIEGSTRPTAALGANVISPLRVAITAPGNAAGRLDVWVGGTRQTTISTTATTADLRIPVSGTVVDVVYTQPGRTDFLRRETVTTDVDIDVMTDAQAYPVGATDNPGTFALAAPSASGVTEIIVSKTITSDTETNKALIEQVKATANYNALIQARQSVDMIGSDGLTSGANMNPTFLLFNTTNQTYNLGYIRSQDSMQPTLVRPPISLTLQGGGTVMVQVIVASSPAAFDAAVTQAQLDAAVGESSDVANSLRFVREGRNSVLPVQETYDPDVEY